MAASGHSTHCNLGDVIGRATLAAGMTSSSIRRLVNRDYAAGGRHARSGRDSVRGGWVSNVTLILGFGEEGSLNFRNAV